MSGIPDALAAFAKQAVWVAWNDEGGRKVPKSPRGGNAKSNDPASWGTYAEAAEAVRSNGYSGVGIMLSNGLVGIDLDDVVGDGGEVDEWAREIIDGIGSYAEVSPSGSGVHVLAYADPTATEAIGRADHAKGLEVYNHGRYFTVTGNQIGEGGIANRTSEVLRLLERHFTGESPEDKLRRSIGTIARDQVRRRGNQTMLHNAKRDKLRYARVPMGGETCAFCAMLASRGFVYHSAATAGEGNHYHHDCRCKVVPGFDGIKVEGYEVDKYKELYYGNLVTNSGGFVDLRGTLKNMDKAMKSSLGSGDMTLKEWRAVRDSLEVDKEKLATREYKRAVKEAFGGNPPETALADIRRILRHRSGTPYEDLYAYDITNGKRLASVTTSEVEREVRASGKMKRRIKEAIESGAEVAMLHNHPGSNIPSVADIASLRASGASFGVIACHDGSLYRYSLVGEPAEGYTLNDKTLQRLYDSGLRSGKKESAVFKGIERGLGVRIEHIR